MYGTMDKASDTLYKTSLKRGEESPDVVHLTHLTTPESIYHLRLGFASVAANPHSSSSSNWYIWLMWPVTLWSMLITWIYGRTFVVERNRFNNLKLQTWAIPKYNIQVRRHLIAQLLYTNFFLFNFLVESLLNSLIIGWFSTRCNGKRNQSIA